MGNAEVFISYHTKTGGDVVHKIVSILEKRGITCWYAPRNVGDNYAHSIVKAIRGCRVFLLVLNKESNNSAHVLNEINCAFNRFKNHEDIVLLPFRIDSCDLSDDIYYYLGRIHIMDGVLPPEEIRIQELAARISALLGKQLVRAGKSIVASLEKDDIEKTTYRLIGSMVYPDSSFIGREQELNKISECLNSVENKVFLVGMGGMGKSEIARMYLKRNIQNYDVVLWITFTETLVETISNDSIFIIKGLTRTNYMEDSNEMYFKRKLNVLKEIADRKVLIVIDNFDVTDDKYLEEFCSGTYSIIFTTRYHQKNKRIPEIEINRMSTENQLMELFQVEYTKKLSAEGREHVKKILNYLGGHPLSIRLVASVMQSCRISPENMLMLLNKGVYGIKQENMRAADIIFGRLHQVFQMSTLTEIEQFVLKNLCLVPLSGMSVEKFFDWCELDDFDIIDGLIEKNWVIHNPITDEVHLHPLIADLMQEELIQDPQCYFKYIRHLENVCANTFNISWEEKQKLLEYARIACKKVSEDKEIQRLVSTAIANMLKDTLLYEESCKMYQKALNYAEKPEDRIRLYHHISHTQILGGYFELGCETARIGLEEIRDIPLFELSRELGHYRNELLRRISEGNRGMGNYNVAIDYARKAVDTCEGFYVTTQQVSRGWAEYHLSRSLFANRELNESEDIIRHAFSLFGEVNDEWSEGHCYELLGQILMEKKQFDEALQYNQKAWDIKEKLSGLDNMATNLVARGNIYREMGDEEKAVKYYKQAAETYKKRNCFKMEEKVLAIIEGKKDTWF